MVSHHRTEMTRGSGGNACGRVSTYDGGQGRSASSSLSDLAAPDDQHVRRRPPECGRERAIEKTPAAGPSGLRLGSGIGRSGLLLVATLCLIKPWGASAAGEDIGADPTRIGLSADATEAVSAVAASPTLVTLAVAPDGPGLAATLQEAEEILAARVLRPSRGRKETAAFLIPTPLAPGSVVERDREDAPKRYPISISTYFAFVDDDPCALFGHRVRYVFIDATTGKVKVRRDKWWPRVNGTAIYLLPTVRAYAQIPHPLPLGMTDDAGGPRGDFGDAPDGADAYPGVPGKFPTRFATVNSVLGRPGGYVAMAGPDTIGRNVSKERGAADPADPDRVPNLVDADKDERMFLFVNDTGPLPTLRLAFDVTLRQAPGVTRYVNVLIDRNHDGRWRASGAGDEWVVANLPVGSIPGRKTVLTDELPFALTDTAWARVALTRFSDGA